MEPRRLISSQPFLDHICLTILFNEFPDVIVAGTLAVFLVYHWKWQRFIVGLTAYLGGLSVGTDTFWMYLRLAAIVTVSAHLVKRRNIPRRTCMIVLLFLAGEYALDTPVVHSVRAPNSLSVPGLLDLAPTFIYSQAVLYGGSIPGSRQLLWTKLARWWLWCCYRLGANRSSSGLQPVMRYIGARTVGVLIKECDGSACINVVIDGQPWSNVRIEGGLVLIDGLQPASVYEASIAIAEQKANFTMTTSPDTLAQTDSEPLSSLKTFADYGPSEAEHRIRKFRKDAAKQIAQLRAEVDAAQAKLMRTAKMDERIRHKLHTLRDQTKSLENEIAELNQTHRSPSPEDDVTGEISDSTMAELAKEVDRLEQQLARAQLKGDEEVKAKELENKHLRQKYTKLKERVRQTKEETEAIHATAAHDIQLLIDLKKQASSIKTSRRQKLESEFQASISRLEAGIVDLNNRSQLVKQAATQWA